jgi:hypothetical protein
MKKLVLLALAASRSICNPAPPAQVPEEKPAVPGESAPASASVDPDMLNGEAPPPPTAPSEAFQPVSATLGGGAWEIKGAATTGPVGSDGTVTITLGNYNAECGPARAPAAGDKTLTITIPWEKGAKVDIASLKGKAIVAATFDDKKKKPEPLKGWKPTGTIEVLAAPTKGKSSGRIRIDLENKLDVVKAEIPVRFCFPS